MVGLHRLHRGQFVAANSPCTYFGIAGLGVEAPTLRVFYQGERQCPVFTADRQHRLVVVGFLNVVLFVVLLQERIHILALHAFARDETVPFIAQQFCQACLIGVFGTQCFDERLNGLLWRWKYLLCRCNARPGQAGSDRKDMRE
ncbi:hypothetical protein D3C84_653270 [compost metagenome]